MSRTGAGHFFCLGVFINAEMAAMRWWQTAGLSRERKPLGLSAAFLFPVPANCFQRTPKRADVVRAPVCNVKSDSALPLVKLQ